MFLSNHRMSFQILCQLVDNSFSCRAIQEMVLRTRIREYCILWKDYYQEKGDILIISGNGRRMLPMSGRQIGIFCHGENQFLGSVVQDIKSHI